MSSDLTWILSAAKEAFGRDLQDAGLADVLAGNPPCLLQEASEAAARAFVRVLELGGKAPVIELAGPLPLS